VVLYGGGNLGGTKVFGDTFLLDTVLMNWQRIESPGIVPPPLGSAAAIVLGDYFYVFGGWLGQTPHHQDLGSLAVVYKLSLHNHMWERRDLETECRLDPRASMADVFVNGKWFFFGGMSHRGIVNDVLVLDISNPSEDKKYLRSKMRGSAEKPPPKITPAGGNNV
jgi:N-acetylneuraminic acid mutarotase